MAQYDAIYLYRDADYTDPDNFDLDDNTYDRQLDIMYDLASEDFRNVVDEITTALNNDRVIAFGQVGRWNGDFTTIELFEDVDSAMRAISGNDSGEWEIYVDDGELMLSFTHHDGTHTFGIRGVTRAGEDLIYEPSEVFGTDDVSDEIVWKYMYESDEYTYAPEGLV
jgi:hypothetical protein